MLAVYSQLVEHCFLSKSTFITKAVHARLIKAGVNNHTFIGNRCLQLYTHFRHIGDIMNAFDEIHTKNSISFNICLKGLMNCGQVETVRSFFRRIPQPDVVSWNTMISWHAELGHSDIVWGIYRQMHCVGIKPSGYTYSILLSVVYCPLHGKELHCSLIRKGLIRSGSGVVLGNSLINMYCKLGVIDYAFGVFSTMEQPDSISWNSVINGYYRNGYGDLALDQFILMRSLGFFTDKYTCSLVIAACTETRSLEKGEQVFSLCIKSGFLCYSIVSSAIIDLFSKCNRLNSAVQLFEEVDSWDSAICNSMISSYSYHGLGEHALQVFIRTLRYKISPTEFTISSVLTSVCRISLQQGPQFHSLAVKIGIETDDVVASSLLHMYGRLGLIEYAKKIFYGMPVRDLICWNTMIMCLAQSGRFIEAMHTFNEVEMTDLPLDRISLSSVLFACNSGGFVDEGIAIFSKMEERYSIRPSYDHYTNLIGLLCRANRFDEVAEIAGILPYKYISIVLKSLLQSRIVLGDAVLAKTVSKRLIELEPYLCLPYLVLCRIYEMNNQWEDLVRIRESMNKNTSKEVRECSWIGIKNCVYTFEADDFHRHACREIYSMLDLVDYDIGMV